MAARAFVAVKGQLDRTVYFIALDGEECGCTGSNHYAFRAPAHPVARTVYVLNIDQIGQGGGLTSHSGHGGYGDDCEVDGEVFARAGMRAQTLVGSNDHYHQCGDTAGTVNYQSAISTVRRAFDLVWSAAQGGGQSSSSVSATPPASSAPSTSSPSPPAASPGRSSPMDSTDTMPR
jgi:Zn-dependent M28 family amino/carboxypeptidase